MPCSSKMTFPLQSVRLALFFIGSIQATPCTYRVLRWNWHFFVQLGTASPTKQPLFGQKPLFSNASFPRRVFGQSGQFRGNSGQSPGRARKWPTDTHAKSALMTISLQKTSVLRKILLTCSSQIFIKPLLFCSEIVKCTQKWELRCNRHHAFYYEKQSQSTFSQMLVLVL